MHHTIPLKYLLFSKYLRYYGCNNPEIINPHKTFVVYDLCGIRSLDSALGLKDASLCSMSSNEHQ